LDFAREEESVPLPRVVERLLAEAVPGEEETARILIPEGKGEHPPQPLDTVHPPLLPGMHHHFRVRSRLEAVAQPFEFGPQLLELVDLPVVADPAAAALVGERLASRLGEVDDREPPVRQGGGRVRSAESGALWAVRNGEPEGGGAGGVVAVAVA